MSQSTLAFYDECVTIKYPDVRGTSIEEVLRRIGRPVCNGLEKHCTLISADCAVYCNRQVRQEELTKNVEVPR